MSDVNNFNFGITGGDEQGKAFGKASAEEQNAAMEKTKANNAREEKAKEYWVKKEEARSFELAKQKARPQSDIDRAAAERIEAKEVKDLEAQKKLKLAEKRAAAKRIEDKEFKDFEAQQKLKSVKEQAAEYWENQAKSKELSAAKEAADPRDAWDKMSESMGKKGGAGGIAGALIGGGGGAGAVGGMLGEAVAGPMGALIGGKIAEVVGAELEKVTDGMMAMAEMHIVNPLVESVTGLKTNGEEVVAQLDAMPIWMGNLEKNVKRLAEAQEKMNTMEDAKARKQSLYSTLDSAAVNIHQQKDEADGAYVDRLAVHSHYQRQEEFRQIEAKRTIRDVMEARGIGGIRDRSAKHSSDYAYTMEQDERVQSEAAGGFFGWLGG